MMNKEKPLPHGRGSLCDWNTAPARSRARQQAVFTVFSLSFLAAALAFAQQTTPATYETARKVTLKGTVTRIEWTNPRAYIFLNVDDAGTVTNWAVEIGNPLDLEKDGWKSDSVKIGDSV